MIKRIIIYTLFIVFLPFISNGQENLYDINKNLELYLEVYRTLNEDFVDDIDPAHLMKIGIDAMTNSLDPYTRFISESEVESYRMSTEGRYEGIGAVTKKIGAYITVVDIYFDSPAMNAGIKIGDKILKINGLDTKGKSREDAKKIMRGVKGSKIVFEVERYNGAIDEISLTRKDISIPNVPYSGMVSEEIGYIILTTFTANASKNVKLAFRKLKKGNPEMKGLILDLRGNGGGLLREAISLVNIFVPNNIDAVSTKGKVADRDKSYKTREEPLDIKMPLVILINKKSASASEIVSGSIQDLDRGVLMGQRSFGKGLVQNSKNLSYNSRLKLTISKYYIPSGRCIQGVAYEDGKPKDIPDDQRNIFYSKNGRKVLDGGGITPDIKLPLSKVDPIVKELIIQNIIFKYVNKYCMDKDSIVPVKDFSFSNYDDFKAFVNGSPFEFNTKAEDILIELKKELNGGFSEEIESIENQISDKKANALNDNKEEIIRKIELEITNRYYFQSGKAEQRLKTDKEIQAAIELLNDTNTYNALLIP